MKNCAILSFSKIKTQDITRIFFLFARSKIKALPSARAMACRSSRLLKHDVYSPISAEIRTVDSQSDLRKLLWL